MEIPINKHLLIFLAACVLFTTTECATSIQNCPDGSVDVEQNTTGTLICVGYSASPITWEFKSGQSSFSTIGRCTSSSTCTLEPTYNGIFIVTPTGGTSSDLNLTTTFTEGLKNATFACDGVECVVSIVPAPPPTTTAQETTEATTTGDECDGLCEWEIIVIVVVVIIVLAAGTVVVVVILIFKKKEIYCFKTNGNGTGNTPPSNGIAPVKPTSPNTTGSGTTGNGSGNTSSNVNASEKPADSMATGPTVPPDGRARELPQPTRRQGATVAPNETPGVVDNASSSPRTRQLPQPRITEHNMTTSLPPPSLPPLRTQATTSLTSVERNSYAETKKPLPSISPRETQ